MLQKGVYWEKFNETSLPEKADFYSHLNMENITDGDYAHENMLAGVFENIRNMCLKIYERDPALFLSAPDQDSKQLLKKQK